MAADPNYCGDPDCGHARNDHADDDSAQCFECCCPAFVEPDDDAAFAADDDDDGIYPNSIHHGTEF